MLVYFTATTAERSETIFHVHDSTMITSITLRTAIRLLSTNSCAKSVFAGHKISLNPTVIKSRHFASFYSTTTPSPSSANEEDPAAKKESADAKDGQENEAEAALKAQIGDLEDKNSDLMDKYRRSIAESDNMRKRLTKQAEDAKIFGIQGFCKDLLEVADVLNKAVEGVPQEALETESQYMKDMFKGLKLTESQLHQVFKRHGLEQENPMGEKFDPNKHEALFQIPSAENDPNVVMDVQKVGYLLHGRTIRPALVGVSRKP